MTKPIEIRAAAEAAINHRRRLDYLKRRLTYDVSKDFAAEPEAVRREAVRRGHQALDLGLPRIRAYYYAYKGVKL